MLSLRQKKFVLEYVQCGEARKAAIRAGYSENGAAVQGHRLMQNAGVAKAIAEQEAKLLGRLEVTAERLLEERAKLALGDIGRLAARLDGATKPADIAALPDDIRQMVKGWKYDKDGRFMPQLYDKQPNLTALERRLGLYKDGGKDTAPFSIHIHPYEPKAAK